MNATAPRQAAILAPELYQEGYRTGRYTWGTYLVRRHTKRARWVARCLENDHTHEARTLAEVREWLGGR